MNQSVLQWLARFRPTQSYVDRYERMRASAGALFGIVLTGACTYLVLGSNIHAAWLIAPMGASSVLLFAVPSSPLAQPWSLIGGNMIAAVVGITCAKLIDAPMLAAGVAIGISIGGMIAFRCVHPPSGAVALTAVLAGTGPHAHGYDFVLSPVLLNSVILLLTALFYNNATGRRYPHLAMPPPAERHQTSDLPPTERAGITPEDLDNVLRRYNQIIDISRDDLEELILQTEMQAYRRQIGGVKCVDIMSRDVVSVSFGTELADAWQRLQEHDLTALPVVDRGNHVVGIVTKADYLRHAEEEMHEGLGKRLAQLILPSQLAHTDKHEVVGQIMTKDVITARENQSITDLVPLMSDDELHQLPIVDENNRLVGLISQTDLIAALYEHAMAGHTNES
ncbi:HPP family protein [Oxalicibacterium solurbis]|uniref:Membrane protein n=1 Tax=Oxalicibacterium solurbis TaxID=69280 RepID=A0A8J3AVC3_9BURK|nr:HPP family protein [Oxalicibacterium solurbis]GGI52901.1 membrane protein [Oxalicibacterium solurbis]